MEDIHHGGLEEKSIGNDGGNNSYEEQDDAEDDGE
jgi:hypothetical protein